jgi:hypothetical protein
MSRISPAKSVMCTREKLLLSVAVSKCGREEEEEEEEEDTKCDS